MGKKSKNKKYLKRKKTQIESKLRKNHTQNNVSKTINNFKLRVVPSS